jgi:hypothetical protein
MMSIGYGPKIHLRGSMPKHSYMVASATNLFFLKSLFLENLFEVFLGFVYLLIWEGTWGWSFDDFLLLATLSAENHSVFVFLA